MTQIFCILHTLPPTLKNGLKLLKTQTSLLTMVNNHRKWNDYPDYTKKTKFELFYLMSSEMSYGR